MSKYCQGTQRIKIIKQLPVPQVDGGRHLLQTRHRGSGQIRGEEGVRVDLDYLPDDGWFVEIQTKCHGSVVREEASRTEEATGESVEDENGRS